MRPSLLAVHLEQSPQAFDVEFSRTTKGLRRVARIQFSRQYASADDAFKAAMLRIQAMNDFELALLERATTPLWE
jgi:hypothetical protein